VKYNLNDCEASDLGSTTDCRFRGIQFFRLAYSYYWYPLFVKHWPECIDISHRTSFGQRYEIL